MRRIEDINFDEIDFEPYKKDIEEINKMVTELWQDEEIRKIYVKQQISDIEKDFKDIKEYYVDLAQKVQSNWNSLRELIEQRIYLIEPKGTCINFHCEYDSDDDYVQGMKEQARLNTLKSILDKMNEVEGNDKEC